MARRRGAAGAWIIGLVVIVVAAWAGYWAAARYAATVALERIEAGPIAGSRIGCSGEELSGFPLTVDLRCRTVSLAMTAQALVGELGGLEASAPLYRPGFVTATLTSPLSLNAAADGIAATIAWSLATAEAVAGLNGLRDLAADLHSVSVETAGSARLPVIAGTASRAVVAAEAAADRAYRFSGQAREVALTRNGGGTLPVFDVDVLLTAHDFGGSLGTDPRAALRDWLSRGGSARVERIRLASGGAVVEADGDLALSADGALSGNLNLRYGDLGALVDLAERLRPGSREQLEPALAAFTLMTVPAEIDGAPARQTTLAITDGLVSVGILPIAVLPALRF